MAKVQQYGRKWDTRTPRSAISWLMGRVHVGTPDTEIAANIRERCAKNENFTPALVEESVDYALLCHARNRGLYRRVMGG